MNSLVAVDESRLAELEYAPLRRQPPQPSSLERILAGVYRQRFYALLIIISAVGVAALATMMTKPRYTARASVQLEQQTPRVLADPDLDPQPSVQDSDRFLQTQVDRIRSRSLAEDVAARLQLANSAPARKGLGIKSGDAMVQREQAITELQKNVGVQLGLNTRLAQIEFTSFDPRLSAQVANAYAESLAAVNINSKTAASDRAKQYLNAQLADAKKRLESTERQMLAYARSADLTATVVPEGAQDKGGSLRAQQLGSMTDALSGAMARRIDAEQRWIQVSQTAPQNLPEVQDNRAIQDLVAQKAQLDAALQEERQRHTDEYPSVREAAAKIQELDGQINALAANVKTSFFGRYAAAAKEERQLAGAVNQLRGAAMSERERSVGYNSLKREVETNRTFYEGLLQRYKEVAAASGAQAANVTIVDRAVQPSEPSSPDMPRNLALGGMAGLVLAFLFGAARDGWRPVIRTADDIETGVNLPSLGVVPLLTRQPAQRALVDARSTQTEAYHSIAVALEEAGGGQLPKTLLITSSAAAEGKSTSALGLARSLRAMGKRVILVDGDLRRPSLHKVCGDESGPGLSDALVGNIEPNDAIRQNEEHGIDVVSAGEVSADPVALLSTRKLKSVLRKLGAGHDIVIIDGPPVMGLADAVLLARSVQAVLVIVEANRVHSAQLDLAVSRLPGGNVIGAVLTKFDPKAAGVRYGGTDYYSY